jgi:acyl-coenzyme A synthetase/AMP-(fatty) acid ligase
MDQTVRWLAPLLESPPDDAVWAVVAGRAYTYGQLRERVAENLAMLAIHGVGPGSTVVMQMLPSLTQLWVLFALFESGAQVMVADHRLTTAEVDTLLALCRPQFHVRSDGTRSAAIPFHTECGVSVRLQRGRPAQTEHTLVQFTSGSTGRPKVIGRTAESLLAEVKRFARLPGNPRAEDRVLLLVPTVHALGLVGGVLHALNTGATLMFTAATEPRELLRAATIGGATAVFAAPGHFHRLADVGTSADWPTLRLAVSGGEPLPPAVFDRFADRFGVRIGQAYGLTEVGIVAADLTGTHPPPAIGWPAPGVEWQTFDGELWVRSPESPYLFGAEEERFHHGWVRTLDLVEPPHGDQPFRLRGRRGSIVDIGTARIDLTRIEQVLAEHDQVREAVVVGGPEIEAHVGATGPVTADELASWCRQHPGVFVPQLFHVVTALPRTANGKLIRNRALLHAAYDTGQRWPRSGRPNRA